MNTHDKYELPPLPTQPSLIQRKDWYGAIQAYARSYGMECARAAIEAERKRRGEPVAWLYEDELPDNYPYDAMFPYSKVEGVRMFPVYAPQPAEPVKGPSDADIEAIALESGICKSSEHWGDRYYTELGRNLFTFARALLARYGNAGQANKETE